MVGVGLFSMQTIIIGAALLFGWLVARRSARTWLGETYRAAGSALLDAAFVGFVVARLAYIVQWWPEYSATPKSMVAISDGGFLWWVGIPVSLAFVWWRTRGRVLLRRSALTGMIAGVAVWVVANGVLSLLLRSVPPLPDLQVTTLAGQPVSLSQYEGRPVVLNLWASWCPPCRREMPAFEQAQQAFPDIAFVMLNQGESAATAQRFLESEGLNLNDVLLDPTSKAMLAVRSRGLPTTLFFDAQGRQVDSHLGEITMAGIKDKILRRF